MAVKDNRLLISLTSRDKEMLRRLAEYYDVSMAQVVRMLIRKKAKAVGITIIQKRRVRRVIR